MAKQGIEKIDKNFAVETKINEPDVKFYDVREAPFEVYGLYKYRTEPDFKRLPDEIGQNVNPGVAELYLNTSGGRVRFSTNSQYVAIQADMPVIGRFPHMPLTGSAGFDLYVDDPVTGVSRYHRTFKPDYNLKDGYESVVKFDDRKLRHFTIHFPTYSRVRTLHIGLQNDAVLGEGMKYRDLLPIIFYGSSITQGGCVSRPGNIYQSVISRRLGMDYINLGFSGSGRAEDVIVDYMAGLKMSAFVADYDHNAPNAEHLRNTHCKMYQKIRAANPNLPYIMISRVDFDCSYEKNLERRDVIYETYRYALSQGDKNVYFIDGEGVFRGEDFDMCTVDGTHPNDHGFALMAKAIGDELVRAFTQKLF